MGGREGGSGHVIPLIGAPLLFLRLKAGEGRRNEVNDAFIIKFEKIIRKEKGRRRRGERRKFKNSKKIISSNIFIFLNSKLLNLPSVVPLAKKSGGGSLEIFFIQVNYDKINLKFY